MILTESRRLRRAGKASGSVAVLDACAWVALASRIYFEGNHYTKLIAQVWSDDLRSEDVVVEHLGGVR